MQLFVLLTRMKISHHKLRISVWIWLVIKVSNQTFRNRSQTPEKFDSTLPTELSSQKIMQAWNYLLNDFCLEVLLQNRLIGWTFTVIHISVCISLICVFEIVFITFNDESMSRKSEEYYKQIRNELKLLFDFKM